MNWYHHTLQSINIYHDRCYNDKNADENNFPSFTKQNLVPHPSICRCYTNCFFTYIYLKISQSFWYICQGTKVCAVYADVVSTAQDLCINLDYEKIQPRAWVSYWGVYNKYNSLCSPVAKHNTKVPHLLIRCCMCCLFKWNCCLNLRHDTIFCAMKSINSQHCTVFLDFLFYRCYGYYVVRFYVIFYK